MALTLAGDAGFIISTIVCELPWFPGTERAVTGRAKTRTQPVTISDFYILPASRSIRATILGLNVGFADISRRKESAGITTFTRRAINAFGVIAKLRSSAPTVRRTVLAVFSNVGLASVMAASIDTSTV